ncbi:unnamed protein product [Caenorhabditis nigoni]
MPIVSYPVLRCILEHMEANCRISISTRCPEISRVEKRIPLRVDQIVFQEYAVQMNDTEYKIASEDPKKEMWRNHRRTPKQPLILRLYNCNSTFSVKKKIPRSYEVEVATRKLVEFLLGGRNNIRVKLFLLVVTHNGYKTIEYLYGITEMKVSALTSIENGLSRCYPLIQSPLKVLYLYAFHPTDFESPIARTAEKFVIVQYRYENRDIWLETHRNLPNKEVIIDAFNHGLTDIEILDLIEYWRETGKAVGSSFSVCKVNGASIEKFSENVKERFQGNYVALTNTNTFINIKAVSIKIDSESKIVIYGIKTDRMTEMLLKIVMKVMDVESSAELQEETSPLKETMIIHRRTLNNSALIVLPLLGLLLALFVGSMLTYYYH